MTDVIADPKQMQSLIEELTNASWTLAAIAAVLETPLVDALREPRALDELAARVESLPRERIARCLDVVVARGLVVVDGERYVLAPGAQALTNPAMRTSMLGEVRSTLMQTLAYADAATRPMPARGWYHTDPRLLQAQGDSSVMFPLALAGGLAAALDGLDQRLAAPGTRFLDVGVGVAGLAIAMCRAFPQLRVVGLDVFDVPLSIARDNIARAELGDRIELRQCAVEDLREEGVYDLAWLPATFLAPSSVPAAIARARAALKPGGWLLTPTLNVAIPEPSRRAVAALILEQWGNVTASDAIAQQFGEAGLATRTLPGPAWLALVAGQR